MYIDFERVTGYRANFSQIIHATREEALKDDFDRATELVYRAQFDEIGDAAKTGEGRLYDAMKFLVDCRYDMQALAEIEAAKEEVAGTSKTKVVAVGRPE